MSALTRVIAIVVSAGAGALLAWMLVSALGLGGVTGAILMAFVGMILSTLIYAAGVALGQALRLLK